MVTGTQIANEILEMYKNFCDAGHKVDFKNVQRRVYDALNVLSAMDIIRKDKYNIIYNYNNEHIPIDLQVSLYTSPNFSNLFSPQIGGSNETISDSDDNVAEFMDPEMQAQEQYMIE